VSTASPGLSSLLPTGSNLPDGDNHQVATGDGARLQAIVAGAGRPLVLTHGALLSLEAWALLWQPLLAAGHQLIAYDLRGHGRSTLGRSGFGVQAYAQDLAAVLDHFDVRRGVVVAHSTGGIGALALAVTAPADTGARLAGQVLISTAPQGIGDSLQNRLLAPIVFSGLIHQLVRRRRLGTLFTRSLFGSHPDPELVEFARRLMGNRDACDERRRGIANRVHGSANLIQSPLRHDLVDQYRRWAFPLVIGSDKCLFADGTIPWG
jgi:pimeloyl-ACP methyl ester carboxylesterase